MVYQIEAVTAGQVQDRNKQDRKETGNDQPNKDVVHVHVHVHVHT